ncbi:hypothetical protein MRB53_037831 [Persea americana]|nr:hypothetical protein MRB53_037831 [Persea americana]
MNTLTDERKLRRSCLDGLRVRRKALNEVGSRNEGYDALEVCLSEMLFQEHFSQAADLPHACSGWDDIAATTIDADFAANGAANSRRRYTIICASSSKILQDEFDVNIEDESEVEVARSIIALRKTLYNDHDTSYALDLERRWKSKGESRTDVQVAEHNQEVDDDEVDDFDEDGDTEMADDPPQLIPVKPKEKVQPEIDDDGFTKVVSRKHR